MSRERSAYSAGEIIDKGSRVHLPDHTYLGVDPNRTILSRVEEYHAQKKLDSNYLNYGGQSVLQLAQIQQQVGSNSVFTNKAKDTRDDTDLCAAKGKRLA